MSAGLSDQRNVLGNVGTPANMGVFLSSVNLVPSFNLEFLRQVLSHTWVPGAVLARGLVAVDKSQQIWVGSGYLVIPTLKGGWFPGAKTGSHENVLLHFKQGFKQIFLSKSCPWESVLP